MYSKIEIFNREIGTYTIMAVIGMIITSIVFMREIKKARYDDSELMMFGIFVGIGVLVGGSLLYAITQHKLISVFFQNISLFNTPLKFVGALYTIFGGAVFYGGMIGGLFAGYLFSKKKKYNMILMTSLASFSIPLFHFFGRLGCFLGGCCYGIPSKFGFVTTHSVVPEVNDISRFPVQLLEALCLLGLFALFYYIHRRKAVSLLNLPAYLLIYSVLRFFIEYLRGDLIRGFIFGLSTSQCISIVLLIACSIFMIRYKVKNTVRQNNKKTKGKNTGTE